MQKPGYIREAVKYYLAYPLNEFFSTPKIAELGGIKKLRTFAV